MFKFERIRTCLCCVCAEFKHFKNPWGTATEGHHAPSTRFSTDASLGNDFLPLLRGQRLEMPLAAVLWHFSSSSKRAHEPRGRKSGSIRGSFSAWVLLHVKPNPSDRSSLRRGLTAKLVDQYKMVCLYGWKPGLGSLCLSSDFYLRL